MKKVIISIIVVVLLLSGVTVTVMYKMGEKFLEEMVLSDVGDLDQLISEIEETPVQDSKGDESSNTYDSDDSITGDTNSSIENSDSPTKEEDKKEDLNTKSGTSGTSNNTAKPATKKEKSKEIMEAITFTDKMTAAALVAKRLSTEDVNLLKNMATGGLSHEEKAKAKKIAFERFTPEEIKQIKELYNKYIK